MRSEWIPDARSPIPLYYQLREHLREGIATGDTTVLEGNKLKPEEEIAERFQVSRATARRAIMDLVADGLLIRWRSRGTFLGPARRLEHWIDPLESFTERLEASGVTVSGKVIRKGFVQLTQGQPVNLFGGTRFFYLERTRVVNGSPITVDKTYFPPYIGDALASFDLAEAKIWRIMETELNIHLAYSDDRIRAVVSTPYDAKILNVSIRSPLLVLERIVYDDTGKPVEYTHSLFQGDAFEYRVRRDRRRTVEQHQDGGDGTGVSQLTRRL